MAPEKELNAQVHWIIVGVRYILAEENIMGGSVEKW